MICQTLFQCIIKQFTSCYRRWNFIKWQTFSFTQWTTQHWSQQWHHVIALVVSVGLSKEMRLSITIAFIKILNVLTVFAKYERFPHFKEFKILKSLPNSMFGRSILRWWSYYFSVFVWRSGFPVVCHEVTNTQAFIPNLIFLAHTGTQCSLLYVPSCIIWQA